MVAQRFINVACWFSTLIHFFKCWPSLRGQAVFYRLVLIFRQRAVKVQQLGDYSVRDVKGVKRGVFPIVLRNQIILVNNIQRKLCFSFNLLTLLQTFTKTPASLYAFNIFILHFNGALEVFFDPTQGINAFIEPSRTTLNVEQGISLVFGHLLFCPNAFFGANNPSRSLGIRLQPF